MTIGIPILIADIHAGKVAQEQGLLRNKGINAKHV